MDQLTSADGLIALKEDIDNRYAHHSSLLTLPRLPS